MAKPEVPPGAFKWQCAECDTWNGVEAGVCTNCKAFRMDAAKAWTLKNVLTPLEKDFYEHTAPDMLRELRAIRVLLERGAR